MATRQRKTADPWGIVETTTLENGQPVAVWENALDGERRVVAQGLHPAQQPLAEVIRLQDDEDFEETATDRVAAILRRAANEDAGQLRVYRKRQGHLDWCETYTPEQFEEGDLPMLRDTFGPGDYELRLYGKHPKTGKYGIVAKTTVTIAQAMRPIHNDLGRVDNGLTQVLATIADGQRQMLQALTERPQPKDPTEEMTKMLSLMSMMRQAMGIDAQPRSQITEIVSAIRELREASDEINTDNKPDTLLGALPSVLEVVKAGIAQQQQQPHIMPTIAMPETLAAPVAPLIQSAAPAAQANPNPANPTEEQDVFNPLVVIQLKGYLKTLLSMAQKNKSVQDGSDFVFQKLPDELVELMALDNWFELLEMVSADATQYRAWLTQVRDHALGRFDAPEEDQAA